MSGSTLYLMRHGNAAPKGVLIGSRDYPLSELGREQALAWRPFFATRPLDAVWCSPLQRTRQTAALCLGQDRAEAVEDLREISLGEWEGLLKKDIRNRFPLQWEARGRDMAGTAPPGGESLRDLSVRVLPAFENIRARAAAHAASLLVAHQAVIRCILASLLGTPLNGVLDIPQDEAALNVLRLEEGLTRVAAVNQKADEALGL